MHRLSNVAYLAALWQLTATLVEAKCSHDIAERGLAEHLARQEALARMNRMKRQATSSTMNVITEAQILGENEEEPGLLGTKLSSFDAAEISIPILVRRLKSTRYRPRALFFSFP